MNQPTRSFTRSSNYVAASGFVDIGDIVVLNGYPAEGGNTGGYSRLAFDVFNSSAQALADFQMAVKAHSTSDWVAVKTGSGWGTVDGTLIAKTGAVNTLASVTRCYELAHVGAVYAVKFQGQSSGTDVLANGTFTGNANSWTLGSGWAYGTNNVAATAASTTLKQAKASMGTPWTLGGIYEISFVISNYSAGSLTIGTNTDPDEGGTVSANGTYTQKFVTADAHADGLVFTATGFTGTIDTVTAKLASALTVSGGLYS